MTISFSARNASAIQRRLNQASDGVSRASERLSSGNRINRPADDAAGLSISSSLRTSARVFSQGVRNLSDGISALAIAQGSLTDASSITSRLQELATQAANGALSLSQRRSLQTESDQLVSEFNRSIATTRFNRLNLLDTSLTTLRIQGGYGVEGSLGLSLSQQLSRKVGVGTFTSSTYTTGSTAIILDTNGDGVNDILTTSGTNISVQLGNGDGTFGSARTSAAGVAPTFLTTGDFNGDGRKDVAFANTTNVRVMLSNGDGTFQAGVNYAAGGTVTAVATGDYNGDGKTDIAAMAGGLPPTLRVFTGLGTGSFNAAVSAGSAGMYAFNTNSPLLTYDYNGDGTDDLLIGDVGLDTTSVMLGSSSGNYGYLLSNFGSGTQLAKGDFNRDGYLDITDGYTLKLNLGNGSFRDVDISSFGLPAVQAEDFNGDGYIDLIGYNGSVGQTIFGNGDGSFRAGGSSSIAGVASVGDLNGDGVADTLAASSASAIGFANTNNSTTIQYFSLTSQADARSALDSLTAIFNRVSSELGSIGANQSRLDSAYRNLLDTRDAYVAADSRISDADIAAETAQLIRFQIIQNTAAALAGQANQEPKIALSLLAAAGTRSR